MRISTLFFFMVVVSCSKPTTETQVAEPQKTAVEKQVEVKPTPKAAPPSPRKDVEDFDKVVRGVARASLIKKWGEPTETTEFSMKDGVPEFRVELMNDFPDQPDVTIKEDTWIAEKFAFTMWSVERDGTWIGLQSIAYRPGVEF